MVVHVPRRRGRIVLQALRGGGDHPGFGRVTRTGRAARSGRAPAESPVVGACRRRVASSKLGPGPATGLGGNRGGPAGRFRGRTPAGSVGRDCPQAGHVGLAAAGAPAGGGQGRTGAGSRSPGVAAPHRRRVCAVSRVRRLPGGRGLGGRCRRGDRRRGGSLRRRTSRRRRTSGRARTPPCRGGPRVRRRFRRVAVDHFGAALRGSSSGLYGRQPGNRSHSPGASCSWSWRRTWRASAERLSPTRRCSATPG